MQTTDYQAKYFAHQLTRRAPASSVDSIAQAVAGAKVDLNPHQVDAALFAFRSPLAKGALLADEVGLGKTIEAGLVLAQRWAERKRRLLVICPSNLRKQWQQELSDKFFLPCRILEKKSFDGAIADKKFNPFDDVERVSICSYDFAKGKAPYIESVAWDLIVVDEAHRLRNVYRPTNKVANIIKSAILKHNKLLLTATPLQNSLLELYGLISVIDEYAFGSLESFREQFIGAAKTESLDTLRSRLLPMTVRTLRKQVREYVPYTKRLPLLEEFMPTDQEDALYQMVDEYLARPNLQALPHAQRSLITMTLRKLLASSTFAIAGALETMSRRLSASLEEISQPADLDETLAEDVDGLDDSSDEWDETDDSQPRPNQDRIAILAEIKELEAFTELARSIKTNAKGEALLKALDHAMDTVAESKAPRKAIIFTESRKTQDYLLRILSDTKWANSIVLFNGSNSDPRSRQIYNAWIAKHSNTDHIVDSKAANMRQALVDYFRDEGQIMIATEAAAEGINLQFCSLVINYDLPWNPQRIEQRIGRCHRYGQKYDVVVLNFLNQKNQADQRVYELLAEKFKLFSGVFGASDDPLGTIESGVDFEKRILQLYQTARDPDAIERQFRQLQLDMAPQIDETMKRVQRNVLEHLDDEVAEKLRMTKRDSKFALDQFERNLIRLTSHELRDTATFSLHPPDSGRFELHRDPFNLDIPTGIYELPRRSDDAHVYRLGDTLATAVIDQAKVRDLPYAEVVFTMNANVSTLDPYVGSGGTLQATRLTIDSMDQVEDHLILATRSDSGDTIDQQYIERMLRFPATSRPVIVLDGVDQLAQIVNRRQVEILEDVATRNANFVQQEIEKLDSWAEDLKTGLERELKDIDREIREQRKQAKAAITLDAKLTGQKAVRALESRRNQKRKSLYEAQDQIDAQRDSLISDIEDRLGRDSTVETLFTIRWRLE